MTGNEKATPLCTEPRVGTARPRSAEHAAFTTSAEGHILTWNKASASITGRAAGDTIGKHVSALFLPEDCDDNLPARILDTASTGGHYEDEICLVHKDGQCIRVCLTVDPLVDQAGRLSGFAHAIHDVSERRQAEQEALRQEQQFRLLVQGVTDYAIFMLSPDGYITSWNAGAQRIKGYQANEVLGSHFSRFYTEEDRRNGVPQVSLDVAAREGRFEREGWRVRKDGTRFLAHVVIDAIYDDAGKLIGFAKVTRDITERHQAAQALEETRERLMQSQRMEAIGQLTGGIAHDFNNLLTVIVNSLDLLARKLHEPTDVRFLQSAQRAAGRGAELTQQLLAFARRQALQPEVYDVNALIGSFEAILRRACQEMVTVELRLAPRTLSATLDARQFEVALLNLVVNARDAMQRGGTLTISSDKVDVDVHAPVGTLPPGSYIKVEVKDTGCGMTPEVMRRAFDPFFTTKAVGKGTGLGLSQVYGFVTQSGGDVIIDSTPGTGTAISVYLPAAADTRPEEETQAASQTGKRAGKVLIVEDELDVLDVSVEIFRSMGYDVLTAGNGPDAVDILKRQDNIDVLFTDVVMPKGMSGIELATFTRKLYPGIHVILASGYPLPAAATEQSELENVAFISKPFRWTQLLEKIRQVREASR